MQANTSHFTLSKVRVDSTSTTVAFGCERNLELYVARQKSCTMIIPATRPISVCVPLHHGGGRDNDSSPFKTDTSCMMIEPSHRRGKNGQHTFTEHLSVACSWSPSVKDFLNPNLLTSFYPYPYWVFYFEISQLVLSYSTRFLVLLHLYVHTRCTVDAQSE